MTNLDPKLREIITTGNENLRPYDRYEKPVPGMHWLPLSGRPLNGDYECFILRMDPGAISNPHEHTGFEEFYMLEGQLIDSDGTEFASGDFVKFLPESKHSSHTPNGCLLLVILRGNNRPLTHEEIESFKS